MEILFRRIPRDRMKGVSSDILMRVPKDGRKEVSKDGLKEVSKTACSESPEMSKKGCIWSRNKINRDQIRGLLSEKNSLETRKWQYLEKGNFYGREKGSI